MYVDINNTAIISWGPVFKYLSIDRINQRDTLQRQNSLCLLTGLSSICHDMTWMIWIMIYECYILLGEAPWLGGVWDQITNKDGIGGCTILHILRHLTGLQDVGRKWLSEGRHINKRQAYFDRKQKLIPFSWFLNCRLKCPACKSSNGTSRTFNTQALDKCVCKLCNSQNFSLQGSFINVNK